MPRLHTRAAIKRFPVLSVLPLLWPGVVFAQMTHEHDSAQNSCAEPSLRCARTATPTFAGDGSLWLVWAAAGRISVAHSTDLGRSFTPAVAVNPEPLRLDTGPDERPKIAVDKDGRIAVAFAIFKDSAFNGQVLYTRSSDGGLTFAPLRPITGDPESQRFEAIAFDPRRSVVRGLARQAQTGARAGEGGPLHRRVARLCLVQGWRNYLLGSAHREGRHLRVLPARPRFLRRGASGGDVPQYFWQVRARSCGDDLRRSCDPRPNLPR
jgi:hypothetical protein